ncbi:sugar ABC transporter ATP-binding protein, partial [Rhizobium ruizarguesonis]
LLSATLLSGEKGLVVTLTAGSELAVTEARASDYASHAGQSVVFGIRPESITARPARPGYADIAAKIDLVEPLGPETMV